MEDQRPRPPKPAPRSLQLLLVTQFLFKNSLPIQNNTIAKQNSQQPKQNQQQDPKSSSTHEYGRQLIITYTKPSENHPQAPSQQQSIKTLQYVRSHDSSIK